MFDLLPNNGGTTIRLGLDLGCARSAAQPRRGVSIRTTNGESLMSADQRLLEARNEG